MNEVPDPGRSLCWTEKSIKGVCWQNQNLDGTLAGEVARENAVCLPVAAGCHGGPGSAACTGSPVLAGAAARSQDRPAQRGSAPHAPLL